MDKESQQAESVWRRELASVSSRKRKSSKNLESETPKITRYFPVIKKFENISTKLEDYDVDENKDENEEDSSDFEDHYSEEKLRKLLRIYPRDVENLRNRQRPTHSDTSLGKFANIPHEVLTNILHECCLSSLSALAVSSRGWMTVIKSYVSGSLFLRRFQRDKLIFQRTDVRLVDYDFLQRDPYFGCGMLLKSISILLESKTRIEVFLNVGRNLFSLLGNLSGFGRIIHAMTKKLTNEEKRHYVKAAILCDPHLHSRLFAVFETAPGQYPDLEILVRSSLTSLFLWDTMSNSESRCNEAVWLSLLLKNFVPVCRDRLFFILFGPLTQDFPSLTSLKRGIAWDAFSTSNESSVDQLFKQNTRLALRPITRAFRLLAKCNINVMHESQLCWNAERVYNLFSRVQDLWGEPWRASAKILAFALDPRGLLRTHLLQVCESDNFDCRVVDATNLICQVRWYLFYWKRDVSTELLPAFRAIFKKIVVQSGPSQGVTYSQFIDSIWESYQQRVLNFLQKHQEFTTLVSQIEMQSHSELVPLLDQFQRSFQEVEREHVLILIGIAEDNLQHQD